MKLHKRAVGNILITCISVLNTLYDPLIHDKSIDFPSYMDKSDINSFFLTRHETLLTESLMSFVLIEFFKKFLLLKSVLSISMAKMKKGLQH